MPKSRRPPSIASAKRFEISVVMTRNRPRFHGEKLPTSQRRLLPRLVASSFDAGLFCTPVASRRNSQSQVSASGLVQSPTTALAQELTVAGRSVFNPLGYRQVTKYLADLYATLLLPLLRRLAQLQAEVGR